MTKAAYDGNDGADSVGYAYALGRGVEQDDEKAVVWFREAARDESVTNRTVYYGAVANLGVMYALGRGGLPKDEKRAVALFERAVRREFAPFCAFPQAHTALAICLYEGRGTKQDAARAYALFREAADFGHPQAQLHVGVLCWRGEGTEKSPTNALAYLEAAAIHQEPGATEWRAVVAKELTAAQREKAASDGRSIATRVPPCSDMWRRKPWNFGLPLANLAITESPR